MKPHLTNIARGVLCLMALAVFSVCGILLPEVAREEAVGKVTPPIVWPFFVGAWILATPIFVALHKANKILGYIDQDNAFSTQSVTALKTIKLCTITFGCLVALGASTAFYFARLADPTEDIAGNAMIAFILIGTSGVIVTFVAVLQRLVQNAVDMKSENELTV